MGALQFALLYPLLLLSFFESAEMCMGLGGCGGGGGCGRCCARARGSKTLSASGTLYGNGQLRRRIISADPNGEFFECCKEQRLPQSCLNKCSYSTYNQATLRNMFFGLDACPIQAANDIHFCATRGVDHRQCCMRNGVTTTLAGDKCLLFCASPTQNETLLDFSFMPCYERFESMKSCFWKSALAQSSNGRLEPIHSNPF